VVSRAVCRQRETSVGRTQSHVWSGVALLLMADSGTAQAGIPYWRCATPDPRDAVLQNSGRFRRPAASCEYGLKGWLVR